MKLDNIKILASDIDGTLGEGNEISEANKKAIADLQRKGILFGITSGRPIYQIKRNIANWNLEYEPDFLIGMNGCQLYDYKTNITTEKFMLSCETIKEIIEYMKPFADNSNIMIYLHESMLFEKWNEGFKRQQAKYKNIEDVNIAKDVSEFYAEPNCKVMYRLASADLMPIVEEYIEEHPTLDFIGKKTQADLMEYFDPNVNKFSPLKEYADKYNIDLKDVCGIGDMTNDYELIANCGIGICMANGSPDCKSVAKYITEKTCLEDGFADFMQNYIL